MTTLRELVPPIEVSRLLLLGLVAGGAVVSVVTSGVASSFAGGFAAGAGSVFLVSFAKSPRRPAGQPDGDEDVSAP